MAPIDSCCLPVDDWDKVSPNTIVNRVANTKTTATLMITFNKVKDGVDVGRSRSVSRLVRVQCDLPACGGNWNSFQSMFEKHVFKLFLVAGASSKKEENEKQVTRPVRDTQCLGKLLHNLHTAALLRDAITMPQSEDALLFQI